MKTLLVILALLVQCPNVYGMDIDKAYARIHEVSAILERETGDAEFDHWEQCSVERIVKRFKLQKVCQTLLPDGHWSK